MYAPTKRSSFRRSSERTTEADRQAAHEVRRLAKLEASEPQSFAWEDDCLERERLACGLGARNSGLVTKPTFEELYGFMEAEDLSTFDADGLVR